MKKSKQKNEIFKTLSCSFLLYSIICFSTMFYNNLFGANTNTVKPPVITSKYFNMKKPGLIPEVFAPKVISIKEGVHGNVVFTNDFSEISWTPNYQVDKSWPIYTIKLNKTGWGSKAVLNFRPGCSNDAPFYSINSNKLFFISGTIDKKTGRTMDDESFWYVKRKNKIWSNPRLLDKIFKNYGIHWQFYLDKNENIYFGGAKKGEKELSLFESKKVNYKYTTPERLPETINKKGMNQFSPHISPDGRYMIFTRLLWKDKRRPPKGGLFISFKKQNNAWDEAVNFGNYLDMGKNDKFPQLKSAARISPDGKYIFFTNFNGKGHYVYWVDARIIDKIKR